MNELMEVTVKNPIPIATALNAIKSTGTLGPAVFTITETALIVSVGPSRLILTAEGIVLDAPRIDLNPEETS